MQIRTIEFDFEYQMKQVIEKMRKYDGLKDLNSEELQDKLWEEYVKEFAHEVLDRCYEFSGDELFEK